MRVHELVAFIKEREAIRVKKEAGKPQPWTKNEILATYRFCNVRREDDRVSRWIAEHMRSGEDIWFKMIVARLLNNPESLAAVMEYITPFKPKEFARVLAARKAKKLKNFNAAYIVSTNGHAMEKVQYLITRVLAPIWDRRESFRLSLPGATLEQAHDMLSRFDGLGSFMAAQVVADLKYTPILADAPDWWTFASSGPGSRRGLSRVVGRPVALPWREAYWRETLGDLQRVVNPKLSWQGVRRIHAQDLQNCLCEFDKYERARLGEGRPKQHYRPTV